MKRHFSFIGAGNVAHSLVPYLQKYGFIIDSIISRNYSSAKDLAEGNNIKIFSDKYEEISKDSDYYIISVNDEQLENAAERISNLDLDFHTKIFIHLSGAKTVESLNSLINKGGNAASIHFMSSFPNKHVRSIENIFGAIETSDYTTFSILSELLKFIRTKPFRISSHNKALYHLMGIFSLNFISANFNSTEKIIEIIDDEIPQTYKLFGEAAKSVINNYVNEKNLFKSLSGPIKRGEIEVIKNHLKVLGDLDNHNLLLSFIANSISLLSIIQNEQRELTDSHKEIKRLLISHLSKINSNKL